MGWQTGGANGNPVAFHLPGGVVHFSTAAFQHLDGRWIEGDGISPDIPEACTIANYCAGSDPDLAVAEAALSRLVHDRDYMFLPDSNENLQSDR